MKTRALLLGALASLALCACSSDDDDPAQPNITSTLAADDDFDTLLAAVEAAGLTGTLNGPGPFTLLAPTDAAFDALPPGTLDALLLPENSDQLAAVLQYHLLGVEAFSQTVTTLESATTVQGDDVLIDQVGAALYVNDARVTEVDRDASNGVIHVIDTVLLPPASLVETLTARGFTTLLAAVEAAELADDLSGPGPRTLLAPTDAAFAALPPGTVDMLLLPENQADLIDILTYHVVGADVKASQAVAAETASALNGVTLLFLGGAGAPTVNGVTISHVNIPCTNAILHVIDAVLIPAGDIPTVATEAGFTTLVDLVVAAGLDGTLAGDGPFTVFAPTNAAFEALGTELLDMLTMPENQELLADILTYHVAADELTATEVLASETIPTVEGNALTVGTDPPSVDGVPLDATNVLARNGIVHVIGQVLLPPDVMLPLTQGPAPIEARSQRTGFGGGMHDFLEFGVETLPAWYGAADSAIAGWDGFDGPLAQPLRPTVAGSEGVSLFLDRPGARVTADGALASPLPLALRASIDAGAMPGELSLQVRVRGEGELRALLVAADSAGASLEREADELHQFVSRVDGAREFSFRWRPRDAGAPISGAELRLESAAPGLTIESLRVSRLD